VPVCGANRPVSKTVGGR
jgi:hypothetical protein